MKQVLLLILLLLSSTSCYANIKLSGLPMVSSNSSSDLAVTVSNPSTSAQTNNITWGNVTVGKATAMVSPGTQCNAGNYPLGVDVYGNAANCTPLTSGSSILYGNGAGGFSNVTIGSNLTFSGGTLSAAGGGGGGTPGGSNQQVQYNNSSAFGGSSNFVFDGTNVGIGSVNPVYKVDVSGTVRATTAVNTPAISNLTSNGFVKTSSNNGTLSIDGATYLQTTGNGSTLSNIPTSLSNSDGSLTFSASTGAITGSVNMANANTWTGTQTFSSNAPIISTTTASTPIFTNGSKALVSGSVSGNTTKVITTTGSLPTSHLGMFDASGNLIDSGITGTGSSQWTTSGSNIYVSTYNVGIGTSLAPASALDIAKNVSIGTTYAGNVAAPTNGLIVQGNVGVGTATALNNAMTVQGSIQLQGNTSNTTLNIGGGNVGIGTPTPGQILDVAGTMRATGFNLNSGIVNGYYLKTDANGNGTWAAVSGNGTVNTGTQNQIAYYASGGTAVSGSNNLAFDGTNVGIGSLNPNYNLNIKASNPQIGVVSTTNTQSANINFVNDAANSSGIGMGGSTNATFPNDGYVGTYSSNDLALMTNTTARVWVKSGGNVGIGSATPGQVLDVNGAIRSTAAGASSFSSNVGIGTATPPTALYVVGTVQATTGLNIGIGTASAQHLCIANGVVATCL